MKLRIFILCIAMGVFSLTTHAQDVSYAKRHTQAVRASEPPTIDGVMDEAVWDTAPVLDQFYDRISDGYSKIPTEARILYDDDNFYVVIIAYGDTSKLVATERKYDRTRIFQDDQVQVTFDTFHDQRRSYIFGVNPLGTRLDARSSTSGFNIAWDADWEAETTILPDRWITEMRIPIGVMYLDKTATETWGVNFFRDNREANEFSRWSYNPNIASRTERYGELRGLDLSNVTVVTDPDIETYASVSTTKVKDEDASTRISAGLDASLRINSHWITTVTVNPDFGQVEADSDTIELRDTERFLPERRPFFNEGAELFRTPLRLYNSRRITDIEVGAKITGTGEDWTLAALDIQGTSTSTGDGNFLVSRYTQRVTDEVELGGVLINATGRDGDNTVFGLDSRVELGENTVWTTQATFLEDKSRQSDPNATEQGDIRSSDYAWVTELEGGTKPLFWEIELVDISEGYSPDLGFISRDDIQGLNGELDLVMDDVSGPVERYGGEAEFEYYQNHDGMTTLRDFELGSFVNFDSNIDFFVQRTEDFHHPYDNHTNTFWMGYNMQNRYKSYMGSYSWGEFQETKFKQFSTRKPFRIGERYTTELTADYRLEEIEDSNDEEEIWLVRCVNEYTFAWEGRVKLTVEESSEDRYNRTLLFAYEDVGVWDFYIVLNDIKESNGIESQGVFSKFVYRW
ncbi:MAG: DUF5916 domain-containing protein [Candidatus Hydrogenedentota bacterium]